MDTLDQVVSASWHADEAAAQQFFEALHETAGSLRAAGGSDGATDVAALRAALTDREVPAESVDALIDRLEQAGTPLDEALDDVVAVSPNELVDRYNDALREAHAAESRQDWSGAAADGPGEEDPQTWNAYLAENGPAWDGAEDSWAQFSDWFLYHAAQAGIGQSAQAFIGYVAKQPDKVGAFAAYGVDLADPGAPTDQEVPAPAEEAPAEPDGGEPDSEDGFSEGDLAALFGEAGIDDLEPITVEVAVEVAGDRLIKEFRDAHPEFEDTSDEELRGLLTEILTEEAAAS